MTLIENLARFVADIQFEILPPSVIEKADRCVAEALQSALLRGGDPRVLAALETIQTLPGACPQGWVPLLGMGQHASPEDAAFYYAMRVAADPRLDTHRRALCHPGSVAVPVALALAQANGLSGKRVIEALVAGYEAMIRLGLALGSGTLPQAVRRTALCSCFCGAVTAAKMLELNEEQTARAAALSCHFSFGLNEWAIDGTGEDAYHSAWGARCGIFCAKMAKAGAPASLYNLEGPRGLFAAYGVQETGATAFLAGLEETYLICQVEHKPIDACLLLQSPCQLASQIRESEEFEPSDIERIEIEVAPQVLRQSGMDRCEDFTSEGQTTNSLPYGVSAHLLFPPASVQWQPNKADPSILKLAKRCTFLPREDFISAFPKSFPCQLRIRMSNGQIIEASNEDYIPLSEEGFDTLFADTVVQYPQVLTHGLANPLCHTSQISSFAILAPQ